VSDGAGASSAGETFGGPFVSKIVLCVDDSATMQQVAEITFRGTEFTYVGARSYEEGLDKAKTQRPAVVLADSVMPGRSGYDLCLALKGEGATANVPVVILVGNGAAYDVVRGAQVGADAILPKPWDTQTMLDKVAEIVTKAASGVARPGSAAAIAAAAASAGVPAPAPAPAPATAAAVAATAASAPAKPAIAVKLAATPAAAAAAAAQAAAAAAMPPRSATIMGMPTIKMPAGTAPSAAAVEAPAVPAVPALGVAPAAAKSAPVAAPAPAITLPGSGGGRTPAPVAAAAAAAPRAPLVTGTATKRSALVERALAKMAARLAEASGLEPGSPELLGLLKLSTEVVERIVWEVVPDLAEQIIRENLAELTARRS
jgi:CheY-like chemotaxis protein